MISSIAQKNHTGYTRRIYRFVVSSRNIGPFNNLHAGLKEYANHIADIFPKRSLNSGTTVRAHEDYQPEKGSISIPIIKQG
jgi:hypothetical protein